MNVLIATEARLDRTPDGACWHVGDGSYAFWARYLAVFEGVGIVARVRDVDAPPARGVRADGPQVTVVPLPYYVGPWQYVRHFRATRTAGRRALAGDDAIIVRAPGMAASVLVGELPPDRPFAIEVIGDPRDSYGPGGIRTVLRPLLHRWFPRVLRAQCSRACAVAYVARHPLQQRYPAATDAYVTNYSSIDLGDEAFVRTPPAPRSVRGARRLVFVGSLEQLYKGPDVLIDAMPSLVADGFDVQLTIVGDGRDRPALEARAQAHGVRERVRFAGHLAGGAAVRRELDDADLFVIPSRTEGLPRALIEAMARGLPCIGSDVGGIPELLAATERVPAGDSAALARRLSEVLADTERLGRLAAENLAKAREYHTDVLQPRRRAFYAAVHDATMQWRRKRHQAAGVSLL